MRLRRISWPAGARVWQRCREVKLDGMAGLTGWMGSIAVEGGIAQPASSAACLGLA
jgi:hypothetical protein